MVSRLYTHNLQVRIVDSEDNPIDCPDVLREIKRRIHRKKYTHTLDINGHALACTITWKWRELTKQSSLFIGDMFACPIYRHDSIVFSHTNATIREIEREIKKCQWEFMLPKSEWSIAFYITKLMGDAVPLTIL